MLLFLYGLQHEHSNSSVFTTDILSLPECKLPLNEWTNRKFFGLNQLMIKAKFSTPQMLGQLEWIYTKKTEKPNLKCMSLSIFVGNNGYKC